MSSPRPNRSRAALGERSSPDHATGSGGSGVPAGLLGEVLETLDELLDAVLVGEQCARARELAAEEPVQDRVEEQHRVRPERPIRARGLEEVDGRAGQAAELDLARDLLHELVALLIAEAAGLSHGAIDLLPPLRQPAASVDAPPARVRVSRGTDAEWYTRGRRAARFVTTSQEFVCLAAATSATAMVSPPWRPISTNSSAGLTGSPGTSVTSAMTASIATLPTSGTRWPRTMAAARFERARDQPS